MTLYGIPLLWLSLLFSAWCGRTVETHTRIFRNTHMSSQWCCGLPSKESARSRGREVPSCSDCHRISHRPRVGVRDGRNHMGIRIASYNNAYDFHQGFGLYVTRTWRPSSSRDIPRVGRVQYRDSSASDDEQIIDVYSDRDILRHGHDVGHHQSSLLHLMGLWESLSAGLQSLPGDPNVVAQAMRVCLGSSETAPHFLSRGVALAMRLAELPCSGKDTWVTCDVIAAAIVSTVYGSANVFPFKMISDKLGKNVAQMSQDVVKVSKLPQRIDVYDDDAAAAIRDMCLAFYDINATGIEVINRLMTLEEIQRRDAGASQALYHCLALEALQVYAPLGHALGIKRESLSLENISLELLFPSSYKKTLDWLNTYVSQHDAILESARKNLETAVASYPKFSEVAGGIQVESRTKSAISTLKKLLRLGDLSQGGRKREEVFDVLGLRAIVLPRDDLEDSERAAVEGCYIVERVAAGMWPVIESRSKDYIASPKPNGYSSLHRTVVMADGEQDEVTMVELQIRTEKMHQMAEKGDAAHGAYKGGLSVAQAQNLQEIQGKNLDQITSWLSSSSDEETYSNVGEALFRSIDLNGDGEVSLSELHEVMEELGDTSVMGAEELLKKFDTNSDGVISLEEFMEFQKLMGLSSAIAQMDETYAQSLTQVTSSDLEQAPKGPSISNRSQDSSNALHVWGRGRIFGRPGGRHSTCVFRDGEDHLSSGSSFEDLGDEPGTKRNESTVRNGSGYGRATVITIDQEHESFDARVQPEIGPPPAVPADPPSTREENVQATPSEPNYASSFDNAMHGFRRLFGKAGTEKIEATWSLEGLSAITVENCAGKKVPKNQITLPRHGPVIFGAVHNKDNDYIIDIPTVSGRHARFEVIRDRVNGISKCVIMDMGSTNGVWVNRSKIQPFKEVHLFPGDVICLAEPGIAFKVDANDSPPTACPATKDALLLAESLEAEAATLGVFAPKMRHGRDVSSFFRKLVQQGEYQAGYMLLLGEAMRNPEDGSIWAQLAGIERQRARRKIQYSNAATVRVFLRAAIEQFELVEDPDERRRSLARVFTSWALLEFDMRNDGPARILFQKGVRSLKKLSDVKESTKRLGKLLCSWATREWKLNDLVVAARLCSEALEVDQSNPYILTLAGKVKSETGSYQEARKLFKAAVRADKSYLPALQAWGKMEASLNNLEYARKLFRAACSLEESNQYILQAWAVAESNAGFINKARDLFKQCIDAHPTCRAALHGWAKLEEENGLNSDARLLYRKVLELKPKSRRALSSLGRLERLLGDLDESERLLRKAIAIDSKHVASLQELANTLKMKKQFSEAHTLEKKVTRLNASYRSQLKRVKSTEILID